MHVCNVYISTYIDIGCVDRQTAALLERCCTRKLYRFSASFESTNQLINKDDKMALEINDMEIYPVLKNHNT